MADQERVYLCRSPGNRLVRGGHVLQLQRALAPVVASPLSIDGIYGEQCETAVRLWQAANNLPVTGKTNELTWRGITGSPPPSLFHRCLALTAAFEGHGYTLVAGNFDGAYLTWGIVGFTLKHGNLGKVITRVDARHPGLLDATIGATIAGQLRSVVADKPAQQRAFAESISLPPKKYKCNAAWTDAFEALGHRPEVRVVQEEVARDVYWTQAIHDLKTYGRMTEADAALFFDTAVQNGGVNDDKAARIRVKLEQHANASDRERLSLIADAIAEGSNPKYIGDVRARRRTIAQGSGDVHGARYKVDDWAIDLSPVTDAQLA